MSAEPRSDSSARMPIPTVGRPVVGPLSLGETQHLAEIRADERLPHIHAHPGASGTHIAQQIETALRAKGITPNQDYLEALRATERHAAGEPASPPEKANTVATQPNALLTSLNTLLSQLDDAENWNIIPHWHIQRFDPPTPEQRPELQAFVDAQAWLVREVFSPQDLRLLENVGIRLPQEPQPEAVTADRVHLLHNNQASTMHPVEDYLRALNIPPETTSRPTPATQGDISRVVLQEPSQVGDIFAPRTRPVGSLEGVEIAVETPRLIDRAADVLNATKQSLAPLVHRITTIAKDTLAARDRENRTIGDRSIQCAAERLRASSPLSYRKTPKIHMPKQLSRTTGNWLTRFQQRQWEQHIRSTAEIHRTQTLYDGQGFIVRYPNSPERNHGYLESEVNRLFYVSPLGEDGLRTLIIFDNRTNTLNGYAIRSPRHAGEVAGIHMEALHLNAEGIPQSPYAMVEAPTVMERELEALQAEDLRKAIADAANDERYPLIVRERLRFQQRRIHQAIEGLTAEHARMQRTASSQPSESTGQNSSPDTQTEHDSGGLEHVFEILKQHRRREAILRNGENALVIQYTPQGVLLLVNFRPGMIPNAYLCYPPKDMIEENTRLNAAGVDIGLATTDTVGFLTPARINQLLVGIQKSTGISAIKVTDEGMEGFIIPLLESYLSLLKADQDANKEQIEALNGALFYIRLYKDASIIPTEATTVTA